MDTILVSTNGYKYKGDYFPDFKTGLLLNKISKNRCIMLMGEPLLVKIIPVEGAFVPVEDIVERIINKEFFGNTDLLFHYEHDNQKNIVYFYAIKNGLAVEKILKGASRVEVIPVEILVRNIISKRHRKLSSYVFIIKIDSKYYLIDVENNYIINTEVKDDLNEIINIAIESKEIKKIIFDKNIEKNEIIDYTLNTEQMVINIGERVYEKLLQKQRFYPQKLFFRSRKEKGKK